MTQVILDPTDERVPVKRSLALGEKRSAAAARCWTSQSHGAMSF
jgi:hypothetical protein